MESVKDPMLQMLRSHVQEALTTVEQCILDLVEWYLQGLEPQGGRLEPLSPASDAAEPVAPHSTQEQEFVLRPSEDEEQNKSLVKIKDKPGADCVQATNVVLQEDAANPEPEGLGPTTNSTSDRGRSDRERSYPCDSCPKSFKWRCDLKKHKRVHTGERPYPCDACPKSFSHSSQLKPHSRIHTGERPFTCDVCPKSFNRSYHLKTHKLLHTGERPYPCGVCEKSFRTGSEANQHKKIHRERSFSGTEPGEGEPSRRHSTC